MRAAEYVRVSTDHQQYCIVNQQAAIAEYAAAHGFEIVQTYADPAKSGLDIKRRPGLQNLLDDVLAGRADYKAVLVFDISRWGRFQDSDEAACYEFLCKRVGIKVHYCAEAFPNDDTPVSALLKTVKRTMAAEYLRDLSARVFAGQCRLAAKGFKMGGSSAFGLRRVLLDADGKPKMLLADGERKSLTTERVTYILGPEDEVALVRRIYSMFLHEDMGTTRIARTLNEQGMQRSSKYGPWTESEIRRILTHPLYAGCAVFNRTSRKLGSKSVVNPEGDWVILPNAFPAVVTQSEFELAQQKRANFVHRRSNDRLLTELRASIAVGGRGFPWRQHPPGLAAVNTYRKRFGSIMAAYEAIGYRGSLFTPESFEGRSRFVAFKSAVVSQLKEALNESGCEYTEGYMGLRVDQLGEIIVLIGKHLTTPKVGQPRWRVKTARIPSCARAVVARLEPGNRSVKDLVLLRTALRANSLFTISPAFALEKGTLHANAADLICDLLHSWEQNRKTILQ